jgi:heme/copper-type cytochrome/quinol oxidase subunit 2/ferredoxin
VKPSVILLLLILPTILLVSSAPTLASSIEPWLNPRAYNISYGDDVLVYYVEDFQFGFRVRAIQKGNVEIIYPQTEFSARMVFQKGDSVVFRVKTIDVVHGFNIFHYLPTSEGTNVIVPGEVYEFGPILMNVPGKFKIRDPVPCDALNPFEYGDIVVEPNNIYYNLLLMTIATAIATLLYITLALNRTFISRELDLLGIPLIGGFLRGLLKWRGSTFLLQLLNLAVFLLIIIAGLIGNPTGGMNFSITVVWVLWFAAVEFMIFFGGRVWCTMCPMPVLGEWIARRRIVEVSRKWFSLNRKWPERLDNMWISAMGFLGISLFIVWITTRPIATAILFVFMILIPIFLHLYNPKRYFCRSVCPANYIGYHANASILAVRAKDRETCVRHRTKECASGSPTGYGCPWELYPGGNNDSTYCGQCFECFRSCPLDNMTLKLRMPGRDIPKVALQKTTRKIRYDEVWMGFIRFSLAIFYELIFFGTYNKLKDWADMNRTWGANWASVGVLTPTVGDLADWFKWAILVSGISLILFPAIFYTFSWVAKKVAKSEISTNRIFAAFSYSLAPYGQLLWMSFAVALFLVNWARPLNSFLDPFGFNWDVLANVGLDKFQWHPLFEDQIIMLEAPFVFAGLFLGIITTYNIGRELFRDAKKALKSTAVMTILYVLCALIVIWIIAG